MGAKGEMLEQLPRGTTWKMVDGKRVYLPVEGQMPIPVAERVPMLDQVRDDLGVALSNLSEVGKAVERLTGQWPFAAGDDPVAKAEPVTGLADTISDMALEVSQKTRDIVRVFERLVGYRDNERVGRP